MKNKSQPIEIDVNIGQYVIPQKSKADILIAVIENLLYQRNQIPFVFKTFKFMVSKWKFDEQNDEWDNFVLNKQRKIAVDTMQSIKTISENIRQECDTNIVKSARILFGNTILTPKEAYIIRLPEESRYHAVVNHKEEINRGIKNILMSLTTSEALYDAFSTNIGATNVFLELEKTNVKESENNNFSEKDFDELPKSCRVVTINILGKPTSESLSHNCCRNMVVYGRTASAGEEQCSVQDEEGCEKTSWFESKIFVKGFKDVPSKGRNIWDD